ncbi:Pentatricopeptide repeat-containing protein [Cardamine amara subsp. amara]|uniref:Pentatricopeptide repeat-containing protein n=1 Tax=Cardamine amara subsp. amara TaxID=228776 RepID=A0ABD0ZWQ0_CARAN
MKWSIVKRIPIYGGPFTSMKHMVLLAPADLSWSYSFSAMHSNTGEEDKEELLKKMVNHSEIGSKIISKIDYTNLVDKYTRDGNVSAAYDLLQSLQDKNICLPISVFKNLLAAVCEQNDVKLSCRIFRELLITAGKEPLSSDCYLNFARAFINTDDCTHFVESSQRNIRVFSSV